MFIVIYHCCISLMHAALAQSVERRLGKAEVGGSIPLGSLQRKPRKPVKTADLRGFCYVWSDMEMSDNSFAVLTFTPKSLLRCGNHCGNYCGNLFLLKVIKNCSSFY